MKILFTVAATVACCWLVSPSFAQDKKPWETISQRKCSEIVDAKANLKPPAGYFFYWFDGYIYGLKAASSYDNRLKSLNDKYNYKDISAMVLAFCSGNQDDTLISATTAVAEMLINMLPGNGTIELDWR